GPRRHGQADAGVARPPSVVLHVGDVGPDLAVEGRAARVEDADDRPGAPPELEPAAEPGVGVARRDAGADDDLAEIRAEHAPGDEVHAAVDAQGDRLDAAHEDVLAPALACAEEGLVDDLRGRERLAVRPARDPGELA